MLRSSALWYLAVLHFAVSSHSGGRGNLLTSTAARVLTSAVFAVQTLQSAVSSTAADSLDAALASVTDVQVSGDLQVAKVYVSVTGSERTQEQAMQGLARMRG